MHHLHLSEFFLYQLKLCDYHFPQNHSLIINYFANQWLWFYLLRELLHTFRLILIQLHQNQAIGKSFQIDQKSSTTVLASDWLLKVDLHKESLFANGLPLHHILLRLSQEIYHLQKLLAFQTMLINANRLVMFFDAFYFLIL